MSTLTVEQTRVLLATDRPRLDAIILRSICLYSTQEGEWLRPHAKSFEKSWHWKINPAPGYASCWEGTDNYDLCCADMWRALPRDGRWNWSINSRGDVGSPGWYCVCGYSSSVATIRVSAPTLRDALVLALAACGLLKEVGDDPR